MFGILRVASRKSRMLSAVCNLVFVPLSVNNGV